MRAYFDPTSDREMVRPKRPRRRGAMGGNAQPVTPPFVETEPTYPGQGLWERYAQDSTGGAEEYIGDKVTRLPQDQLADRVTQLPQDQLADLVTRLPQEFLADKLTVTGTPRFNPNEDAFTTRKPGPVSLDELPDDGFGIRPKMPVASNVSQPSDGAIVPQNPSRVMDDRLAVGSFGGGKDLSTGDIVPTSPYQMSERDTQALGSLASPGMERPEYVPTYAPGKDPNKSKLQNKKDEIDAKTSEEPNNKRGFKNTLKGAGVGFLKAFAASDPRMSLRDRLLWSVGGAGGGAIGQVIDPNSLAKMQKEAKLQQLYDQYGQMAGVEENDIKRRAMEQKAQTEAEKANLDIKEKGVDIVNKRAGDFLKTATSDNKLDDREAAVLSELTGLPYTANDWRKVIRLEDQGVPFITREGEESARIDPSRPINPSEAIKNRTIDGQTFAVPDKTAFGVAGNVAVGNANRQQQASQFQVTKETQEAEKEFTNEKDYNSAVTAHSGRVRKAKADAAGASKIVSALNTQLQKVQATRAEIASGGYDTTEIDKQITDIETRKAAAEGNLSAAQILANEPAPKKLVRPKNPSKGKYSGMQFSSPVELKSYFPGKTDAAIRKLVEGQGGEFVN